ncbi:MAG: polysaccharide deacetylase family protein [Dongiaceae bacterium]
MSDWHALARECDAWEDSGRGIELWWRDDDAGADTPDLRRLIAVARVPLALAVIPARLEPSLAALLGRQRSVSVLQHGFDHRNRAPAGAKKSEFPATRPWPDVAGDLARGRDLLAAAFGTRFVPVLTPPWNRIDAGHASRLPSLGYRGLTAYLARPEKTAAPGPARGFAQVNTHVDVIDWRGARGFVGRKTALDLLARHLAAKRLGQADPEEPTGLLTHHLVHDTETWDFLGALLDWCAKRPNIEWRGAADLFPEFGE